MILEKSFMLQKRLISDADRSPNWEKIPIRLPKSIAWDIMMLGAKTLQNKTLHTMLLTMPPKLPSIVLFGLIRGESFFLPKSKPEKNAPVSQAHVITKVHHTYILPLGRFLMKMKCIKNNVVYTNEKTEYAISLNLFSSPLFIIIFKNVAITINTRFKYKKFKFVLLQ